MATRSVKTIDDEVNALFRLPLSEFIEARKILASQLKKEGRSKQSDEVKSLTKPSVSAWTVNQLYWRHREQFDRLLATGQQIRKAQTSGRAAEMRETLGARRELLSQLSDLAAALLRGVGHNPTLDVLRRIATTLEAMSAYASLPNGLLAGRLTADIDPPGFDSLAGFSLQAGTSKQSAKPVSVTATKSTTGTKTRVLPEASRLKETRQARLVAAKASLQEARKSLRETQSRAQTLAAAQKKADVEAKQTEKRRNEAERRRNEAVTAAEAATRRLRNLKVEVEQARKAFEEAQRTVDKRSKELESVFSES